MFGAGVASDMVLTQDEDVGVVIGGVETENGGGRLVDEALQLGKVEMQSCYGGVEFVELLPQLQFLRF